VRHCTGPLYRRVLGVATHVVDLSPVEATHVFTDASPGGELEFGRYTLAGSSYDEPARPAATRNPQVSRRETCKCVSAGWAARERVDVVENVSGPRVAWVET